MAQMKTHWQPNRMGYMNFWLYDEQNYDYEDGNMLLTGANGHGKSVTMNCLLPILLDGNMQPQRLDSFGTRDRTMGQYIINENDDVDERTGYCYLEFKKAHTNSYMTVGYGVQGKRNKTTPDLWLFIVKDNSRINYDFKLYREGTKRVPLSKKEMKNLMALHGEFFDSNQHGLYEQAMNDTFFGFENIEEYRELVNLVNTLKSPKLISKDLKPTDLNEILSKCLQPLSDDELNTAVNAFENMNDVKNNLDNAVRAKESVKKLFNVYSKYRYSYTLDKVTKLEEQIIEYNAISKKIKDFDTLIDELKVAYKKAKKQLIDLDAEHDVKLKEINELTDENKKAVATKNSYDIEKADHEKILSAIKNKKFILENKENKYRDVIEKIKNEQNLEYEYEKEVDNVIEDMENDAANMNFCNYSIKGLKNSDDYDFHDEELLKIREYITKGEKLTNEITNLKNQEVELDKNKTDKKHDIEKKESELHDIQNNLLTSEQEWLENFYLCNKENQFFKIDDELEKQIIKFIHPYKNDSCKYAVKEILVDTKNNLKDKFIDEMKDIEHEIAKYKLQKKEQENLLESWKNKKEPVPDRDKSVIENRKILKESGIPYIELYKIIDFDSILTDEECNRLEESLLKMGLLDALLVDEQYKEKVLSLDKGLSDKYLFPNNTVCESNLSDILSVIEDYDGIEQRVYMDKFLKTIGYNAVGKSSIYSNDTYTNGSIVGKITGTYTAKYIGVSAREKEKQKQINECIKTIEEINSLIEDEESKYSALKEKTDIIESEYSNIPEFDSLDNNLSKLKECKVVIDTLYNDLSVFDEKLDIVIKQLKEKQKEEVEYSEKYIKCDPIHIERAKDALLSYKENFSQLKVYKNYYNQCKTNIETYTESKADYELDIDNLKYELENLNKKSIESEHRLENLSARLNATGYQDIKERLDKAKSWLDGYVGRSREMITEISKIENKITSTEDESAKESVNLKTVNELRKKYEEDYYSHIDDEFKNLSLNEVKEILKERINSNLKTNNFKLRVITTHRDIREDLYEYPITVYDPDDLENEDFANDEELNEHTDSELIVTATLKGVPISLEELVKEIEKDVEEKRELLRVEDRRLFEDILSRNICNKIRSRINAMEEWTRSINSDMSDIITSSNLKLSIKLIPKQSDSEGVLDTKELRTLLNQDFNVMSEANAKKLVDHFRKTIEKAQRLSSDNQISFLDSVKEALDYRKWYEFRLCYERLGSNAPVKELTNRTFGTFSGGERAIILHVPLFAALSSKYNNCRKKDAPRMVALDECFAGIDDENINALFGFMSKDTFNFDYIINSQSLRGDFENINAIKIHHLVKTTYKTAEGKNKEQVVVISSSWNGHKLTQDSDALEDSNE